MPGSEAQFGDALPETGTLGPGGGPSAADVGAADLADTVQGTNSQRNRDSIEKVANMGAVALSKQA